MKTRGQRVGKNSGESENAAEIKRPRVLREGALDGEK